MKLINREKLALKRIYERTLLSNKKGARLENQDFIQKGLSRRDTVGKATDGLKEKGLLFKLPYDEWIFRYQLSKSGAMQGVQLFDGIKLFIMPVSEGLIYKEAKNDNT